MKEYHQTLVQVQETHSVAAENIDDRTSADHWSENLFHHNTFLASLTSFLYQGSTDGSHIAAASHPQPTDIGHVRTLSRDRTLRLWTARVGAPWQNYFPLRPRQVESSPGMSASSSKPGVLLDPAPQMFITVYERHNELFSTTNDHFQLPPHLWDCQGQGAVEILDTLVSNEPEGVVWRIVLDPYEPDLTPAYLDELLLSPASLTD